MADDNVIQGKHSYKIQLFCRTATSLVAFRLQVLFTIIISYDDGDLSPIAVGWLFTCIGPIHKWPSSIGTHSTVNTSSRSW